jgi:hypothetical protein
VSNTSSPPISPSITFDTNRFGLLNLLVSLGLETIVSSEFSLQLRKVIPKRRMRRNVFFTGRPSIFIAKVYLS